MKRIVVALVIVTLVAAALWFAVPQSSEATNGMSGYGYGYGYIEIL